MLHAGQPDDVEALRVARPSNLLNYRYVGAHLILPHLVRSMGTEGVTYFTVVREPVERMISMHSHIQRLETHSQHKIAMRGLEYWLSHIGDHPSLPISTSQAWFIEPFPSPDNVELIIGDQARLTAFLTFMGFTEPLQLNVSDERATRSRKARRLIEQIFPRDFEIYEDACAANYTKPDEAEAAPTPQELADSG